MLKLTMTDGRLVYVSPAHVAAVRQTPAGDTVIRFASGSYYVRESPDQIMAMPEMMRHLNPMVTLPVYDSFYRVRP